MAKKTEKFKLEIKLGNEALNEENASAEIVRLLRKAADHIEAGKGSAPLIDINGNRVGEFQIV